jgi:hypothetical protein
MVNSMEEQVLLSFFVDKCVQSLNNGEDKNKAIISIAIFIENYYCIGVVDVFISPYPN